MQPMTLEQMERLAWESAIGHHLSDYPDNMEPSEILELVENENEAVLFWEPFEYWDGNSVANQIESMQRSLLEDYKLVAGIA